MSLTFIDGYFNIPLQNKQQRSLPSDHLFLTIIWTAIFSLTWDEVPFGHTHSLQEAQSKLIALITWFSPVAPSLFVHSLELDSSDHNGLTYACNGEWMVKVRRKPGGNIYKATTLSADLSTGPLTLPSCPSQPTPLRLSDDADVHNGKSSSCQQLLPKY